MLSSHPMMRALLAAAVITIPTVAHAGGYLGLGIGTEPAMSDRAEAYAAPSGRSLRVLSGMRFGMFSIEGNVTGFGVVSPRVRGDHNEYTLTGAGKLSLPFGSGFEGFARLGVERTWLSLDNDAVDMAGNGWVIGGGFEYRFDTGIGGAAVFVDYNVHTMTLENQAKSKMDATYRLWTLGFSVGI
jgi:hypothetical protein